MSITKAQVQTAVTEIGPATCQALTIHISGSDNESLEVLVHLDTLKKSGVIINHKGDPGTVDTWELFEW